MTQPPSFQPKHVAPRPSAEDATIVAGRRERMSTDPEPRVPRRPAADAPPSIALKRPTAPRRSVAAGGAGERRRFETDRPQGQAQATAAGPEPTRVAPPTIPPRQRPQGEPRQRTHEPLGLPMDTGEGVPARPSRPVRTAPTPAPAPAQRPPRRRRPRWGLRIGTLLLVLIVAIVGWVGYLAWYGNKNLTKIDALSGAPDTPGTTVLLAGSDGRSADGVNDGVEGERSDTIMLVHIPTSGNPSLISLPRDTYVEIPGVGPAKLNAAYSLGGPSLLVQTVESMTGLTVDNYVEIGMTGVSSMVDAVGGVNLCLDYDVNDTFSGLVWEAGCHDADGQTALAFTRMRYSDPLGDIGRTERQRQVVGKVMDEALSAGTLVNPLQQRDLVGSVTSVLTVDNDTSFTDLGKIGWSMRSILGPNGIIGTPPIADFNYRPGNVGSTVLLDQARIGEFWAKVADGSITPEDVALQTP